MTDKIKHLMAGAFSLMFLVVAASLAILSLGEFTIALIDSGGQGMVSGIVRAMNTAFISLATFELGAGIGKEYALPDRGQDLFPVVRRTIARFVSVVCIAMALKALIMVIEYSQIELPGNLYYPVAVTAGASVLLVSLGVFIHLTRKDVPAAPAALPSEESGVQDRLNGGRTLMEGRQSIRRRETARPRFAPAPEKG